MVQAPSVEQVAEILRGAPADQPWRREAPLRAEIRRRLCLAGWTWHQADWRAYQLVARGRMRNGARAPVGGDHNDLSTFWGTIECEICGRFVIQRHHVQKYCGLACQTRAQHIRRRDAAGATQMRCDHCGDLIEDPHPLKKFCSKRCSNAAFEARKKALKVGDRECQECGAPIPFERPVYTIYCGERCNQAAFRRRRHANGHAKPNGHDHHEDDRRRPAPDHRPAAGARPNGAGNGKLHPADRVDARGGEARASRDAAEGAAAGGAPALREAYG